MVKVTRYKEYVLWSVEGADSVERGKRSDSAFPLARFKSSKL